MIWSVGPGWFGAIHASGSPLLLISSLSVFPLPFIAWSANRRPFAPGLIDSTPSEFIQVLEPSLRRRPHAEPDDREVMRRLLPHMQVRTLPRQTAHSRGNRRWFWNCSFQEVGQEVQHDQRDLDMVSV